MHKRYNKIEQVYKNDNHKILDCDDLYIEEKIDGANLSVWWDEGICIGSRNNEIYNPRCKSKHGFNGAIEYILNHGGISALFEENKDYRLYGEWLVKHTVEYSKESYHKFYLFDIETPDCFMPPEDVKTVSKKYQIEMPKIFHVGSIKKEELDKLVGKSELGDVGEGVVLKSKSFLNSRFENPYVKVLSESFSESTGRKIKKAPDGTENKTEKDLCEKLCTQLRVEKIIKKIEFAEDRELDLPDTPKVIGITYNDVLEEEFKAISKAGLVNFGVLSKEIKRKAREIFHNYVKS